MNLVNNYIWSSITFIQFLNIQIWTPKGQIDLIWVDGWFHMNLVSNYIWRSMTFIQFLNIQIWTPKGQMDLIWVDGWFHMNLVSNYIWSLMTFIQFLNIQIWTSKGQIKVIWVVGWFHVNLISNYILMSMTFIQFEFSSFKVGNVNRGWSQRIFLNKIKKLYVKMGSCFWACRVLGEGLGFRAVCFLKLSNMIN
jgi:hypothetical protein